MSDKSLEPLDLDECIALLRTRKVGRIAVVVNEFPVVLPINYALVETSGPVRIALRTRSGNVIATAPIPAAFEIDAIDADEQAGWSVLVRGTLHPVNPDVAGFRARFDPHPWVEDERDAWRIIEPFSITGRRLSPPEFSLNFRGYL